MLSGKTSYTARIINQELFQDLKQFITATVSQQTATLHGRIDGIEARPTSFDVKVKTRFNDIEDKIDDLSPSIGNTFDDSHNLADERFDDHKQRIGRLEHSMA